MAARAGHVQVCRLLLDHGLLDARSFQPEVLKLCTGREKQSPQPGKEHRVRRASAAIDDVGCKTSARRG